jgi:hypothetical protein
MSKISSQPEPRAEHLSEKERSAVNSALADVIAAWNRRNDDDRNDYVALVRDLNTAAARVQKKPAPPARC